MLVPTDLYSMGYGVGLMIIGGGATHIFKKYLLQSDNQEKTLPVVTQSILTLTECIKQLKANDEKFFERTDKHEKEITEIQVLHKVLKCADKFGAKT